MNWTTKAWAQRTLSRVPKGGHLYSFLQRRVLRSLPPSDGAFVGAIGMAEKHREAIRRHLPLPVEGIKAYEFGAGSTLTTAMAFYSMGIDRQTLTDVFPLARPWLLEHTVAQFHRLARDRYPRMPELPLTKMGIRYLAPSPPVPKRAEKVNLITTTSVLEHLPANELGAILSGLAGMLSPDGIMIHHIDYSDHYSHGDSISPYNFLRYSDREWERYNSALHFQNRLRHSDYLDLIASAGFEILSVDTDRGTPNIELDPRFQRYEKEDLSILHGFIVARVRPLA